AVATLLLGGATRTLGRRKDRGDILVIGSDRHHTDAAGEFKHTLVPFEAEILHRITQRLGRAQGLFERSTLEQHAVLVATQPRERVAPADLRLEQRADLTQQGVTGGVPAGIVDHLELVKVQVTQGERALARARALQTALDAALELAPVHKTRQRVVAGVIGKLAIELATLAHVVEDQYCAHHLAGAVADR